MAEQQVIEQGQQLSPPQESGGIPLFVWPIVLVLLALIGAALALNKLGSGKYPPTSRGERDEGDERE